ncbi:MAG: D-alanine--D-alanine ligase [Myxococcota bacterium]
MTKPKSQPKSQSKAPAKKSGRRKTARKKLRVLMLMHEDLVPPEDISTLSESEFHRVKTESDILQALAELGHETKRLGVRDAVLPIRHAIEEWEPDIVFNLLDEFQGEAIYDQHVVAYLELLKVPYTGNNPRGLVLARDKALSKKVAMYHRIPVPKFFVSRTGRRVRRPKRIDFPLIVKSLVEEASMGISKASIVRDDEALETRVHFMHERVGTDAIVEEFISGREIYVGVLGNDRLIALPPRELIVDELEPGEELIATESLKHNVHYQKKHGVRISGAKKLPEGVAAALEKASKRIYRMLSLEGYARIDYRLSNDGKIYFLEANPNPELAKFEELAEAAAKAGLTYPMLIQRILNLGLKR